MTEVIEVQGTRADNRVVIWEKTPKHPGGELFVAGEGVAKAWPTPRVTSLIKSGQLIVTSGKLEITVDIENVPEAKADEPKAIPETFAEDVDIDATDGAESLANEYDIDLATVIGTGANGRVLKKDVEAHIEHNLK